MTRCPTCHHEMRADHIGRDRSVLLCEHCWTVHPPSLAIEQRQRRDLE